MKIKKLHISFLMKNNKLFTNSAWGVFANIFQNIFFSIFFVIMARLYNKIDFANYIIANTLYSFFVGFSTLGLGYWFIRELINTENKINLIEKFFKIQLILGLIFFFLNIIITSILYSNSCIQSLSLIMGINIIFDNIIYVIKYLNIAEQHQKKSSILSTVEALLKCIFGFILFIYPVNIFILSVVLIGLRLFTLNLFIRYGCSDNINLKKILLFKINISEFQSGWFMFQIESENGEQITRKIMRK